MDPVVIAIWILRLAFLGLLYVFLGAVVRVLLRDLRAAAREPTSALGRLVVIASPGEPPVGTVFPADAVTTLGRDVNNTIVLDDSFVSGEHALITFRGRGWFLEDLGSTNGTFLNGEPVAGVAPVSFGDEVTIGGVRLRLERPGG
ncbi:MAG TPA: FHA domain-containing protein [Candidatus Polarisedimenticolia bacterium]|nr:FHA domain-containing protein [Candidatus Polarisedimenticolia bacterium]